MQMAAPLRLNIVWGPHVRTGGSLKNERMEIPPPGFLIRSKAFEAFFKGFLRAVMSPS
jgi:hypothetical protein